MMYPNPTTNLLQIKSDKLLTSVRVFNVKGQLVWENENPNTTFTLEMKEFGKGLYLVEFSTASKTYTKNVIVK